MWRSHTKAGAAGRTNRTLRGSMGNEAGSPQPLGVDESLPHALTFFLSTRERRRVLRRLRNLHPRREVALLIALDARHDDE